MPSYSKDTSLQDPDQVTKQQYEDLLTDFFQDVHLTVKAPERDLSFEQTVIEACVSLGVDRQKSIKAAKTGITLAQWMYPHHERSTRIDIALYTAHLIQIEDIGTTFPNDIRDFRRNMMLGNPQHSLLEACLAVLSSLDRGYDRFSSDKFATGAINFMGCTLMEFDIDDRFKHLETAPRFPYYFRTMTGVGEAYAYFVLCNDVFSPDNLNLLVQAAPDMTDFIGHANDFLSFYKESIASIDKHNYVHQLAKAQQRSVYEILSDLSDNLKGFITNVRATVSGNPALLQYTDAFLYGYLAFHVYEPRYRLSELTIPSVTHS